MAIGAKNRSDAGGGERGASVQSESPETGSASRQPLLAEIRDQLARILASPTFQSSARREALLRYLVEEALAGRADRLKGYTIGVDVFGLDETFDPKSNPFVRLEARRLRRDLDGYYATAGRGDPVRISVPKGAYVPLFEWRDAAGRSALPGFTKRARAGVVAAVGHAGGKTTHRSLRRFLPSVIVGIAILMIAIGGWLWKPAPRRTLRDGDRRATGAWRHGNRSAVRSLEYGR